MWWINTTSIIAVSGGPDSIFLLNKYGKNKKNIVCTVNYNTHKNSNNEYSYVKKIAKQKKLIFEGLIVTKAIMDKYSHIKNKEAMYREIRYDFFLKISNKYKAKRVLMAHHKDDFIETAIMQEKRNKKLLFYGINKTSKWKNLEINRPFINKYFKSEILEKCKNKNIRFFVDPSNFDTSLERNKVRAELSKLTKEKKEKIFKKYLDLNKFNRENLKYLQKKYAKWEKSDFYIDEKWKKQSKSDKKQLIYWFLTKQLSNIKISGSNLINIIDFVENSNNKKKYKISDKQYIDKNRDRLSIKEY